MQEAGIPVTFGYISDTHDQHGVAGEIHATRGPGEADYVQQLKDYDAAFASFFERLANDGIDKSNTLFVFTVEEGDHFVGSQPSPAGCDGVNVPCTYPLVGEVNGNLAGLLATKEGITTPFTVHSDMAPTIYLTGNPGRTATSTREFGRALGTPVGGQPIHGPVGEPERRARRPGRHEGAAHGHRRPAADADADDVRRAGLVPVHGRAELRVAVRHGADDAADEDIRVEPRRHPAGDRDHLARDGRARASGTSATTRLGGPRGRPSDHAQPARARGHVRPRRPRAHRQLDAWAVPQTLRAHRETLRRLGEVYKQLNAPFGEFGTSMLLASTKAVKSGNATDDATYARLEGEIRR